VFFFHLLFLSSFVELKSLLLQKSVTQKLS